MSTDTEEKTSRSTGSKVPNLIRAKGHEPSNFHTWKIQLQAVFMEQELWDVVYGKEKANIPTLVKTKIIKADVDGVVRDVKQIGNEAEYEQALLDNAGWIKKDRKAWRILTECLDADSITLVEHSATTAEHVAMFVYSFMAKGLKPCRY
ncbi:hypothetical protein SISNIDRAFT_488031 [Sistotremastrum niveocremeum HHB9708]|uniref:DUF4219 domain-containing protein n=1 Tax=Sistotremastrum niveocremeum HHB9708 TaxID=1314777 RepID=A0A164RNN2_9AGAM|nr:hypothetical protein SISNIDRAFT_488031 [Sistotremastrum niveocremeum HHB9708]